MQLKLKWNSPSWTKKKKWTDSLRTAKPVRLPTADPTGLWDTAPTTTPPRWPSTTNRGNTWRPPSAMWKTWKTNSEKTKGSFLVQIFSDAGKVQSKLEKKQLTEPNWRGFAIIVACFGVHTVFVVVCLTGCERWTWEAAERCWSSSAANSQPSATSVHTTGLRWSRVRAALSGRVSTFRSLCNIRRAVSSSQVCCPKDTCAVLGTARASTLQPETSRTSPVWTACPPSRWPCSTFPVLSRLWAPSERLRTAHVCLL